MSNPGHQSTTSASPAVALAPEPNRFNGVGKYWPSSGYDGREVSRNNGDYTSTRIPAAYNAGTLELRNNDVRRITDLVSSVT